MNDCESATTTDLGIKNKFQQIDKFTNMQSVNNEEMTRYLYEYMCMPLCVCVSSLIHLH